MVGESWPPSWLRVKAGEVTALGCHGLRVGFAFFEAGFEEREDLGVVGAGLEVAETISEVVAGGVLVGRGDAGRRVRGGVVAHLLALGGLEGGQVGLEGAADLVGGVDVGGELVGLDDLREGAQLCVVAVGGEVGGQAQARAFGCVGDEGAGVGFRVGVARQVGFAFEAQAAGDLFDGRHDVVGNLVVAAQAHAFTEHGFDVDSLEHAGGGDDGFERAELLVGEGS